jgi:hypothetical protein
MEFFMRRYSFSFSTRVDLQADRNSAANRIIRAGLVIFEKDFLTRVKPGNANVWNFAGIR